jgi:glycosyltransferase involved in cell wall biosynthesis
MKPELSIVIPYYDQPKWVGAAVASAKAQTVGVQVIVVDDASPTPLPRSIDGVTIVRHRTNKGLSAARNSGIGAAVCDWVLPLDADDRVSATFAAKIGAVRERNPNVGLIRAWQHDFGDVEQIYALAPVRGVYDILAGNRICCCTAFPKALWERVGGFDEDMRQGYEDWEFWIRCLKTYPAPLVATIPEPLFHYRRHGASMVDAANARSSEIYAYIQAKHYGLFSEARNAGLLA